MRVIPIPPLSMLAFMEMSDAQLILPLHELIIDERYARAIAEATQRVDYLILDNGEAEGERISWSTLIAHANTWGVDEIVLPDVMGNAEATLQAIKDAWFGRPQQYRYMGVAQGENGNEVREMVEYLISLGVQCIGIPRHMIEKRPQARLEIVQWMCVQGLSDLVEIHLLGMHHTFPAELELIRNEGYADIVRSVDTSMPFVAAANGIDLTLRQEIIPQRPAHYFNPTWMVNGELATKNLDWLRGESK